METCRLCQKIVYWIIQSPNADLYSILHAHVTQFIYKMKMPKWIIFLLCRVFFLLRQVVSLSMSNSFLLSRALLGRARKCSSEKKYHSTQKESAYHRSIVLVGHRKIVCFDWLGNWEASICSQNCQTHYPTIVRPTRPNSAPVRWYRMFTPRLCTRLQSDWKAMSKWLVDTSASIAVPLCMRTRVKQRLCQYVSCNFSKNLQ